MRLPPLFLSLLILPPARMGPLGNGHRQAAPGFVGWQEELDFGEARSGNVSAARRNEEKLFSVPPGLDHARRYQQRRRELGAGSASPEAICAERTRSRASETVLSGSPTMAIVG
jgi:hypothetical protein